MDKLNKNFLPSQYNLGGIRKIIKTGYVTNIVLSGILVTLIGTYVFIESKDKVALEEFENKISTISNAVQTEKIKLEEDDYYQAYMSLKAKQNSGDIKVVKDLEFNLFSEMIQNSSNENIKLNNVQYEGETNVIISGQAIDYPDIEDFYKNLMKQNLIKKAEISNLEVVPMGEGKNYAVKQIVKFEIKGVTKVEELKRD
ncbi:hypothetical protein [Bacillus thuringiensis]|uniref:hypothetical protein n=1 Tax=Bacillus thuringiensis TaxID=1428 RepID=UPI0021D64CCE|nr:hypothetical protein [Bacillus thuringiensis]MCU7667088.1 hypothetical protein [Bacillus thuringiensis]